MLSRIAFRYAQQLKPSITAVHVRPVHVTTVNQAEVKKLEERDLVNYPVLPRPLYPGKVRLGFIPDEWYLFFYNKTGVTGPYMFAAGLITYLCSKEIYVMEHEFYAGISLAVIGVTLIKKFGPDVAAYLDKQMDEFEDGMNNMRGDQVKHFEELNKYEKLGQEFAKGSNPLLFAAKKENIALQLEAAYRARLALVHSEVKKKLDYQLETANVKTRTEQKHMVNWIVSSVKSSITPAQESAALKKCIADLKALAPKHAVA